MQIRGGIIVSGGAIVILAFFGAVALHEVAAQQGGGPAPCDTSAECPVSQYCAGGNPSTQPAKEGRCNVPPPIWNVNALANPAGFHQNASINLSGQAAFGGYNLDGTGIAVSTPSLYSTKVQIGFGSTDPGTNGLSVSGNLNVAGCFGPIYKQGSSSTSNGSAGGYTGANAQCPSGMHVCAVEEILNSINCGTALPAGGSYWVNGGPPGYTAPANDCIGWTSNASGNLGRFWDFGQQAGQLTICSSALPFACCQ